jgi:hypothetical protein
MLFVFTFCLLAFLARVVVFCAWAYALGRAFLSGTAAAGGGGGEVCPSVLWLLLLRNLNPRVFFWPTRR